jgi:hypothetical protein
MSTLAVYLVSAALIAGDAAATKSDAPDALRLERQVLAARQAILRGEVSFHLARMNSSGEPEQELDYRITFDGDRLRTDVDQTILCGTGNEAVLTKGLHKYVFTPSQLFYHTDITTPAGKSIALHQYDVKRARTDGYSSYRIDPRVVGVVPDDFPVLHSVRLESFLCRADRKNVLVERDVLGGVNTWHIKYDRADATAVELWVAPDQNHSVVRALLTSSYRGDTLVDSIQCENTLYGQSAEVVWYPQVVRYQRSLGGKLLWTSVLTITQAQFNQPVPEKVFTPAGMNIPKGTMVMEFPQTGGVYKIWDGAKIIPSPGKSPIADVPVRSENKSFRPVSAAICFLMIGVLSMILYWRHRLRT